jgi:hypothetical protein
VRNLLAFVEDAVRLDDRKIRIRKQWNREARARRIPFEVRDRVVADRPDFCAESFERLEPALQLTELLAAVPSPDSSKEDQYEVLLARDFGEGMRAAARRREGERRRASADGRHAGPRNRGERKRGHPE